MSQPAERILADLPRHWFVVPVRGKAPLLGKDWPSKAVPVDEVKTLPPRADGFGLLLGPKSGVVDLEGDGPEAERRYQELVGDDAPTCPCWRSPRGKHRLFAWADEIAGLPCSVDLGSDLSARLGNDRAQSVLPPVNGREWLVLPDECEPPPIPPRLLEAIRAASGTGSNGVAVAATSAAQVQACWRACRKIGKQDANDGSRRLFTYACRAVEHNLDDRSAIALIRRLEADRPFPCDWSDADILVRLRQAERRVVRGVEAQTIPPTDEPVAPELLCLADVEPEPVRWLWQGRMPLGKVSLLIGDPGMGKSLLALDIVARTTSGAPWPDGSQPVRGGVVLVSGEDDPTDTIRPRLDAAGADITKVNLLTGIRMRDEEGGFVRLFDLTRDLPSLEQAIHRTPECKLVVVDPISAYLGRSDSHNNAEVRGIMAPMSELAARTGVAVVCVSHLRKSAGPAVYRGMGSLAFTAAARAVWAVARDQGDTNRRLLLPVKSNLSADTSGMAFRIEAADGVPRLVWEPGVVTVAVDEVLATDSPKAQRGPEAVAVAEATAWLHAALADGPRPAKDLLTEWREGHGGSKRTLDRARRLVGVEAFRETVPGPWLWRLQNQTGGPQTQGCQVSVYEKLGNLGNFAKNTGKTPLFEPDNSKIAKFPICGNLGNLGAPEPKPANLMPT